MDLEGIYNTDRSPALVDKCVQYARYTIPGLFPDSNTGTDNSVVQARKDYQSFLAQMTNHLSAKFVSALFPSTTSFFKLQLPSSLKQAIVADVKKLAPEYSEDDLETRQSYLETSCSQRVLLNGNLASLGCMMQLLIITGNALLVRSAVGRFLAYSLRNYTVLRDGNGNPVRVVLRERRALGQLTAEERSRSGIRGEDHDLVDYWTGVFWSAPDDRGRRTVSIRRQLGASEWEVQSGIPEEVCPYIPLAWRLLPGTNYGTGHVYQYEGDICKYSELSAAHTLYMVEAMRVIHLVKPGSTTDIDEMNDAETGAYVAGDPNDIKAHESGDGLKLQQIAMQLQALEAKLAKVFQWDANTRDAERVTAAEIMQTARALDQDFGGEHSALSNMLHPPLAYLTLQELSPDLLSQVLAEGVQLDMLTGVPALTRSAKVQAALEASQEAAAIIGSLSPSTQRVSPEKIIAMCFAARGLSPSDIYRSADELQQMQQDASPIQVDPNMIQQLQGVSNG